MDPKALNKLMADARKVAAGSDLTGIVDEVDDALKYATEPWVTGSLYLVKSIALQCSPEPILAANAARAAFDTLRETDDLAKTAYAAAAGAVLIHRTGDVGQTVDLAVEAMTILPDVDSSDPDALSATNALAQVFSALSAYGLAVEMAERAFRHSVDLPMTIRGHLAYALATCATNACYSVESPARSWWLALIREAADCLSTDQASPISALVSVGIEAELALLSDDEPNFRLLEADLQIGDATDLGAYPLTGDRLVPWHRLVRASTARRWADPKVAVELLNLAIPQLDALGEANRLARAMEERSLAHAALGQDNKAAEDALELVRRSREWHTVQIAQLADQIAERAELERNRSQLLRQADLLARDAAVDSITGVGTRRWLEVRLNELSKTVNSVGVIIVDLDHFKQVNDQFGHLAGDRVLSRVGDVLNDVVRADDTVARYGGEEFVVLIDQATSADANSVAERIHHGLSTLDWSDVAPGLSVTASAGVADGPGRHVRDVLRLADAALYEAKRSGRNRIVIGQGIHLMADNEATKHDPIGP